MRSPRNHSPADDSAAVCWIESAKVSVSNLHNIWATNNANPLRFALSQTNFDAAKRRNRMLSNTTHSHTGRRKLSVYSMNSLLLCVMYFGIQSHIYQFLFFHFIPIHCLHFSSLNPPFYICFIFLFPFKIIQNLFYSFFPLSFWTKN